MEKRGQVTLFMVVGIMLLLSLSLLYYSLFVKDAQVKQTPNEEPVIQTTLPAKYLVDKCLSLISTQAVTLLGKRGGYIEYRPSELPSDMIRLTEKEELSIFYRRRSSNYAPLPPKYFFPNKESMEKEISRYVKNELRYCLDDFEFFSSKGIQVQMESIAVNTTISDTIGITVNLYFPLTIKMQDKVQTFKDFTVNLPIKLGEILKLVKELVAETERYESALRSEVVNKIKSCDKSKTSSSKPLYYAIASKYSPLKLAYHPPDSVDDDFCNLEPGFCALFKAKVTVCGGPFCDCETSESQDLLPLITIFAILDEEAPQHPFSFLFVTQMSVDTEGTCNKC